MATTAFSEHAPFRTLYNNDTTNIATCASPFNPSAGTIREGYIAASVRETSGIGLDVHMFQPGVCWVPWWKSTYLPMSQHIQWRRSIGDTAQSFENYVNSGHDILQEYIDECRARGITPFVSFRVNDIHHVSRGLSSSNIPREQVRRMCEFQFFHDHNGLEFDQAGNIKEESWANGWLIGPDPAAGNEQQTPFAFDFAREEVRAHKLKFFEEVCRYDIDGLELDLMRTWRLFNSQRTPASQRAAILTAFIRDVRRILDAHSKNDRHRWLCLRITGFVSLFDDFGIDLAALTKPYAQGGAGVDMLNLSAHYYTDSQLNIGEICQMVQEHVAVYVEMHYTNALYNQSNVSPLPPSPRNYYRRNTPRQFYTTAHMAYARGAAGVSTFNFQYYRGEPSEDAQNQFTEPPFGVFSRVRDPEWLSSQDQQFVVAFVGASPVKDVSDPRPMRNQAMRPSPADSSTMPMRLDMAPPAGGWWKNGKLRIQATSSLAGTTWAAKINGTLLPPIDDVSEPYENPYVDVGSPQDYKAFEVDYTLLKDGLNDIEIEFTSSADSYYRRLVYLDICMPGSSPAPILINPLPSAIYQSGDRIVITGNNFRGITGVFFGDIPAAGFTEDSSMQITAIVPDGVTADAKISIRNHNGTATSSSALSIARAPHSLSSPADQVVVEGKQLTLTAEAGGTPPPACRWQHFINNAWQAIPEGEPGHTGITSSILNIAPVTVAFDGLSYRYSATNMAGTATSAAAMLHVVPERFPSPVAIAMDNHGGLFITDDALDSIQTLSADGTLTTFASGSSILLAPGAIAYDAPRGRLIAADVATGNILAIASGTAVPLSASPSPFVTPAAIAIDDTTETIYIADAGDHTIHMISTDGIVSLIAGKPGQRGNSDAIGTHARFDTPSGIALTPEGHLYVADTGNHVIRVIDLETLEVSSFAGRSGYAGCADGSLLDSARFNAPQGIALDNHGNLYIADTGNSLIRKISNNTVSTVAGAPGDDEVPPLPCLAGFQNGPAKISLFDHPKAIAIGTNGNIYIADTGNAAIRKIDSTGNVSTVLAKADIPAPSRTITDNTTSTGNPVSSGGGSLSVWSLFALAVCTATQCCKLHRRSLTWRSRG